MDNQQLADRFYKFYTKAFKMVENPRPRRAERSQAWFSRQRVVADSINKIDDALRIEIISENLDMREKGFIAAKDQETLLIDWGYLDKEV